MKKILLALILIISIVLLPNNLMAREVLVVKKTNGELFNLDHLKNKVVIITLWASWCPNCYAELNQLEKIYHQYPREKLEILALNVDDLEDNKENPQKLIKKFSFPMAFMSKAQRNSLETNDGIPTTYIIYNDYTTIDPNSIEETIKELLANSK